MPDFARDVEGHGDLRTRVRNPPAEFISHALNFGSLTSHALPLSPPLEPPQRYRSPELEEHRRNVCPSALDSRLQELRHTKASPKYSLEHHYPPFEDESFQTVIDPEDWEWPLFPAQVKDSRLRITPTPSPPPTPSSLSGSSPTLSPILSYQSSRRSTEHFDFQIHSSMSKHILPDAQQTTTHSAGTILQSPLASSRIRKMRARRRGIRKGHPIKNSKNTHNMVTRSKSRHMVSITR